MRSGVPPVLPDELARALEAHVFQAGAGEGQVNLAQFCEQHTGNKRPHKLPALLKLHEAMLDRGRNPHDAMREALRVGLGEARIGYVPAKDVIAALREQWPTGRSAWEFDSLAEWAARVASDSNPEALQLVSDRCPGTDSREYADWAVRSERTKHH